MTGGVAEYKVCKHYVIKMGGGSSVPKRPHDCDERKWQKILTMFDDLDTNSNFVVDSSDDITKLSMEFHIKRINALEIAKHAKIRNATVLESERRREFESEMELWRKKYYEGVKKISVEIEQLKSSTTQQVKENMLKEMSPNGKRITFPVFYAYMKDRMQ